MVDQRGKIKTGKKVVTNATKDLPPDQQKFRPAGTDYFVIDFAPELLKAYGEKPRAILLRFASNNLTEIFEEGYKAYKGANVNNPVKVRTCDGINCTHHIAEVFGGQNYAAGQIAPCVCHELKEDDKSRCHYRAYLKALVCDPGDGKVISPTCYLFETGSENSGNSMRTCLTAIYPLMRGNIALLPFLLGVKMVSGQKAEEKFPIWTLTPVGSMEQLQEAQKKLASFMSPIVGLIGQYEKKEEPEGNWIPEGLDEIEQADQE
jgi:hypothetical protein